MFWTLSSFYMDVPGLKGGRTRSFRSLKYPNLFIVAGEDGNLELKPKIDGPDFELIASWSLDHPGGPDDLF